MLNRLLVGTLKAFQKEEKIVRKVENVQAQKLEQVERRLEKTKQEDMDKIRTEKEELLAKRREKEKEIQRLKRTKAIQQYAEDKISHYKRLQNYIQTQTKPPLFYLPAKHTLRTLELLKTSAKKIDVLIEHRKEQMEKELKKDEEGSEDELDVGAVRSKVVTVADKTDEKEEKHEEALDGLGEPPLEEPMEEEETENMVKVRAASPVKRSVETKENGDKSIDQNQNERTNSPDESDGVSAAQKANQRRSTRSRSRSGSSAGSRSRSASRSSTGSGSSSGSSSSGESDEEE